MIFFGFCLAPEPKPNGDENQDPDPDPKKVCSDPQHWIVSPVSLRGFSITGHCH